MKIETAVRKNVLAGNGGVIRDLLLTENQLDLIKYIDNFGPLLASSLSYKTDVSIQNASSKLHSLYLKGYLDRTCFSSESGGLEYSYTAK